MARKTSHVHQAPIANSSRLSELIDSDQLLRILLRDVESAVSGWLSGRPTDEIALLNRITEKFSGDRRNCDVGLRFPVHVRTQIYELHRKGKNQRDLFGSDFAVTLSAEQISFRKTAFIQLKKARHFRVVLEKQQLEQSKDHREIFRNSFVLAANEERFGIRVGSVEELLQRFPNATQSVSTLTWRSLSDFFLHWVACELGEPSDTQSTSAVENYLAHHVIEENASFPWGLSARTGFENDWLIPRAWLVVGLDYGQSSKSADRQLELGLFPSDQDE